MTDFLKEAFDKYLDEMEEDKECECGAIHTSFPKQHYYWCPRWALEGNNK